MAKATALLQVIKKELKRQNMTYMDVADALHLSEQSIKRMFADEHITLQRLDKLCQLLQLDICDLVYILQSSQPQMTQFTYEQEAMLVGDPKLFLVAITTYNKLTFDEIMQTYHFSEEELKHYLSKLEKIGFLSLSNNLRIKVLVSKKFSWLKNGPINAFIQDKIYNQFFTSAFEGPGEKLSAITGMLSVSSNAEIQKRMEKLLEDFADLDLEDSTLPVEKRHGTTMVVAVRPWEIKEFDQFRKPGNTKEFK